MKLASSFPYGMARLGIKTPLSMKEKSYEKTIVKLSWLAMRFRPCVRVRQGRAFRRTCHAADELQIHSIEKSAQEAWPFAAAETQPLTNQRQTKGALAIPLYEISLAEDGSALALASRATGLPGSAAYAYSIIFHQGGDAGWRRGCPILLFSGQSASREALPLSPFDSQKPLDRGSPVKDETAACMDRLFSLLRQRKRR